MHLLVGSSKTYVLDLVQHSGVASCWKRFRMNRKQFAFFNRKIHITRIFILAILNNY
jgi:hypothetical protein